MTQKIFANEGAVSPVVGVMLMLVIVIIIAAVVSAFGGGLMQTDQKAPQASIKGEYSQLYGLTMTHMGGDALETKDITVYIRPSDQFGSGQSEFGVRLLNHSTITNGRINPGISGGTSLAYWIDPQYGTSGVTAWRPGDSMYVKGGPDLQNSGIIRDASDWPPCYNENIQGGKGTSNGLSMRCFVTSINNQINIGKTVHLEVTTRDGRMISSTPMVIEP